jgi:hypothetical protein
MPSDDDLEVLNGRDEVILDALLPKSAPTSALKAVLNGRLAKIALLEPLATLSVTMSRRGVGLLAGFVQQLLPGIAF